MLNVHRGLISGDHDPEVDDVRGPDQVLDQPPGLPAEVVEDRVHAANATSVIMFVASVVQKSNSITSTR